MRRPTRGQRAAWGAAFAAVMAVLWMGRSSLRSTLPSAVSSHSPADAAAVDVALSPSNAAGGVMEAERPWLAHAPKTLPVGVARELYAAAVTPEQVPTADRVALGERLFNDPRLSADDSTSCATCHDPEAGFVDHRPTSIGIRQQRGLRNAPTVLNAMFSRLQFWDGRAASLEAQAKLPILNSIEMGQPSPEAVVAKLRAIPEYVAAFRQSFVRNIEFDDVTAALAAFERTLFTGEAPFDRFIAGDLGAIGESAKRGWTLFNGRAGCNVCHSASAESYLFSDQTFHNIGIAAQRPNFAELARQASALVDSGNDRQVDQMALQSKFSELGRFLVTKQSSDIGAFRSVTLRNVAATAPYMHDGSVATLWDVMDHYNKGGVKNLHLDGAMRPLGLSEPEIDDLVELMTTLTSPKLAALATAEMARMATLKSRRPHRDLAAAMAKAAVPTAGH